MAESFRLKQVLVNDESSFAADSGTFGTNIPVNSATVTLDQPLIANEAIRERLGGKNHGFLGVRTATLELNVNWIGHLTTSVGSLTATWLHNLLGDGLGGKNSSVVGASGGVGSTGVTDEHIGTDHTCTLVDGAAIRVGAKGDARGDGQVSVCDGTAGALHVALGATLDAADDVGGCLMQYPDESAFTALTSKRFLVAHATSAAQFRLLGCQLESASLNLPFGQNQVPTWTLRYQCAYWNRTSTSFPIATALSSAESAPIVGGSFFLQDIQTATNRTRNTETISELNLTLDMPLQPIVSPGGANSYQNVSGWVRTGFGASFDVTMPWEATYETWFDTDVTSITLKHALLTCNTLDSRTVGFYCPRLRPMGNRPSGVVEVNEQNYVRVAFDCEDGSDTDTELTRSVIRFFAA